MLHPYKRFTPMSTDTPETILLAVTGMSPAVVTETVWALAQEDEPIIPDRVIVLTTQAGRSAVEQAMFATDGDEPCIWQQLRDALAAQGHDLTDRLRFGTTSDDLRVITAVDPTTGRSHELNDLRDATENDAAADYLMQQVRSITSNPDSRLIASIAGGRKTMGALLYACMTLVGREDDRITHVLINSPYENHLGFFFPGQAKALTTPEGEPLEAPAPVIDLGDVPFVPISNLFKRELGRSAGSFSAMVASCGRSVRRRASEDLRLEVLTNRPALRLNQDEITLTKREFHLMLCLVQRTKNEQPPLGSYAEGLEAMQKHAAEWAELLEQGRVAASMSQCPDFTVEHDITRTLSDLRRKFKTYGDHGLTLAEALPARSRFSLDVPPGLIAVQ